MLTRDSFTGGNSVSKEVKLELDRLGVAVPEKVNLNSESLTSSWSTFLGKPNLNSGKVRRRLETEP